MRLFVAMDSVDALNSVLRSDLMSSACLAVQYDCVVSSMARRADELLGLVVTVELVDRT
jgi:hypothetical protein